MNEENQDPIEKLNEGLYSQSAPEVNKILRRGVYKSGETPKTNQVQREWSNNQGDTRINKVLGWSNKEQPIFKKILWFALGFFVLAFALAAFLYVKGINTVSADKIDLTLSGQLSVSASNPFALDISVVNKNNSDLLSADILVDYPEGSRQIGDNTKTLVEDLIPVGIIKKDQLINKRSEAVLFGQEREDKHITVTLHYKVAGSSSIFQKKTDYVVTISSAPVTVSVDSVKELNSNQEINFDIKVKSNSANVLKNIAVQPNYPYGFTFENSDPIFNASSTSNYQPFWVIDELAPAESKEFRITGRLKGEKDEEKYFKFVVGNIDTQNPQKILTQFVSIDKLIAIQLPFISSQIVMGDNGGASNDVVGVGQTLRGSISFKNNLSTDVNDLELNLKINDSLNLIDKNRIQSTDGFYSSLDNSIIWSKKTLQSLAAINPGETGQVTFNLPFLKPTTAGLNSGSLKNLMANLELTIKGKRLSDANVPEQIILVDSKNIKVGTETTLSPRALYSIGPFKNTGGIPPQVNKSTSYTVVLSLLNTLNDVKDTVVTATLPPYVTFEGSVFPLGEKITFDRATNKVTWNAGTVFSGQGYKSKPREVAFKVVLTPSSNQVDTIPALVQGMGLEGVDVFTGLIVKSTAFDITTELRQDPGFQYGQDKIRQ